MPHLAYMQYQSFKYDVIFVTLLSYVFGQVCVFIESKGAGGKGKQREQVGRNTSVHQLESLASQNGQLRQSVPHRYMN